MGFITPPELREVKVTLHYVTQPAKFSTPERRARPTAEPYISRAHKYDSRTVLNPERRKKERVEGCKRGEEGVRRG